MNSQQHQSTERWPIQGWTSAPLRFEQEVVLQARPRAIFTILTDPEQMCTILAWMHNITVEDPHGGEQIGLGARRRCHFGNGMVLEELIVGWQPPLRYAYRGVDETHPFGMNGHLGIIECQPHDQGTHLIWRHYFDHSNLQAMRKQLAASMQMAIDSLLEQFHDSTGATNLKGSPP